MLKNALIVLGMGGQSFQEKKKLEERRAII